MEYQSKDMGMNPAQNAPSQSPPPMYDDSVMPAQPQAGYAAGGVVTGQPQAGYGGPPQAQPGYGYNQSATNTTVIINQPMGMTQIKTPRMWSSGICACFDDVSICLGVTFCPVCYSSHLSMKMEESCCLPMCVPGFIITLRTKARMQGNIQGSVCDDCLTTTFCGPCSMCQLSREVDYIRAHPEL